MMGRLGKIVIVVVAAGLAACAQPPVPEDQFYRLQVAMPAAEAPVAKLDGVIEVERFGADGLTGGRAIVYSDSAAPNKLLEYHYHFWTDAPTVLLRDQLVAYLRGAKVGRMVVTPEMRTNPDFIVVGKILRFERRIGADARAIVELELAVRRRSDGTLYAIKTYHQEAPVKGDQVGHAVAAFDAAIEQVFRSFVADLKAL